jgi:hypothetical protein
VVTAAAMLISLIALVTYGYLAMQVVSIIVARSMLLTAVAIGAVIFR